MPIENYRQKKKDGKIEIEFAKNDNVLLMERKYDNDSGKPYMATSETNSQHLKDLIEDADRDIEKAKERLAEIEDRKADRQAELKDVLAKEKEAEKLVADKAKEKAEGADGE